MSVATSEQPLSTAPLYFAGGFGYGQERNQRVLAYLESLGLETVPALPDHTRRAIDPTFTMIKDGVETVISRRQAIRLTGKSAAEGILANNQRSRAKELIDSLERQGHPQLDAIFQSADALNGLLAVAERPDLFNNVVLAYPAGIIEQPAPLKASRGVLESVRKARTLSPVWTAENNFEVGQRGDKGKRSRIPGAFATAASVALSYQGSLLTKIRAHWNAPGVSLVLGLEDWMIRPERVIESLGSAQDVDYILITDTPHGVNGRKDIMDEMLKLFPKMEEQRSTRQASMPLAPLTDRLIFYGRIPAEVQAELLNLAAEAEAKG